MKSYRLLLNCTLSKWDAVCRQYVSLIYKDNEMQCLLALCILLLRTTDLSHVELFLCKPVFLRTRRSAVLFRFRLTRVLSAFCDLLLLLECHPYLLMNSRIICTWIHVSRKFHCHESLEIKTTNWNIYRLLRGVVLNVF